MQGLGLGDAPFHQGITVLRVGLAPMGLIGGDANVVQGIFSLFEPVDFFRYEVGFKLPSTPAHLHSRPAVAGQGLVHGDTALNGPLLLLGDIEHQPLKAMGMAQGSDVDASLPVEQIVQLGDVGFHLRKLHPRVGVEYAVDGHILLQHQKQ